MSFSNLADVFCRSRGWRAARLAVLYRTGFCRRGDSLEAVRKGHQRLQAIWLKRLEALAQGGVDVARMRLCATRSIGMNSCRRSICPFCYAGEVSQKWQRLLSLRAKGDRLYGLRGDTSLTAKSFERLPDVLAFLRARLLGLARMEMEHRTAKGAYWSIVIDPWPKQPEILRVSCRFLMLLNRSDWPFLTPDGRPWKRLASKLTRASWAGVMGKVYTYPTGWMRGPVDKMLWANQFLETGKWSSVLGDLREKRSADDD